MSENKESSIELFHKIIDFKKENRITALSPASVMADLYNEINVSPDDLYTLAEKLIEGIYNNDDPFLYGERIAAIQTISENGFSGIMFFNNLSPDDAFNFLLHCPADEFIAVVDVVAKENQGYYTAEWGPDSGHEELMDKISMSIDAFLREPSRPSIAQPQEIPVSQKIESDISSEKSTKDMLIYMINTYVDSAYGTTGKYDTVKEDIMSATGMSEAFFEDIKNDLDFVHFDEDDFFYDAPETPAPEKKVSLAEQIQSAAFRASEASNTASALKREETH